MRGNQVRVFRARRVITLDSATPTADAVAVMDGKVLHSGTFASVMSDLESLSPVVDERFADRVITPGFIEAHSHIREEGALARHVWVGSYDRRSPHGPDRAGCPDDRSVLDRISTESARRPDPHEVLVCVGWDHNMTRSRGLTREMLDSAAPDRPVFVLQSNGHIGHANSAMLSLAGITADTDRHGLVKNADGEPTGEIKELALSLVLGKHVHLDAGGDDSVHDAGVLARRAGCTTVSDIALVATREGIDRYARIVNGRGFPTRVVWSPLVQVMSFEMKDATRDHVDAFAAEKSDRFMMGPVKFILDGSIQGRSARLNWPGYCCGDPNGMWLADPEEMFEVMLPYHRDGRQIALHANGDEAVDRGLDIFERLLHAHPRLDHRHRLEHAQLASDHAFRRMKTLGVCVNLFANHVWFWGETHRSDTAGPARARKLDACRTALDTGVPFSIHSDAPVTPLDPLFTMWCAVNRLTSAGEILGENERITALDALRAVTMGSAHLLKMDDRVGSLEPGKWADMTVLDDDPLSADPLAIRDIGVAATVLGGDVHPN